MDEELDRIAVLIQKQHYAEALERSNKYFEDLLSLEVE